MICLICTAGAEDIGVHVHDAADARTLVVSLLATQVLLIFGLRVFTYNRPMVKMRSTLISLPCDICARHTCVSGTISRTKSATTLTVPEIMKTAL